MNLIDDKTERQGNYMIKKWQFGLIACLFLLLGCTQQPTVNSSATPSSISLEQVTAISVPPTFTPLSLEERLQTSVPEVTVTQNPLPTVATDTPVPFGQTAVELRYTIPAIGLDRRLQGNVSSQIIIANETTGDLIKRDNQAGVLVELQQLLPDLELEEFPEGCEGCVYVSYILTFEEKAEEGWLTDRSVLASIENYFAVSLGPHFPANTQIGLRRGASPYAPAHTIALTDEGLVYFWFATDAEIAQPVAADPALLEALNQIDLEQVRQQYQVNCTGTPLETLFLNNGVSNKWVNISCPEYALPTSLLPIYMLLDNIAVARIVNSDNTAKRPPSLFPLNGLLDYKRFDGAQLTILNDGTAVAVSPTKQPVTTTLSAADVLSLTTTLLESNQLKLGLASFLGEAGGETNTEATVTPQPARSVLLVRGQGGVYDGFWNETANVPLLEPLNELLNQLIGIPVEETAPDSEETPIPETASPEATLAVEATSAATPEP
mgnify:CR=1 FL=1